MQLLKNYLAKTKDANRVILNVMEDLGGIAARDNFYNAMKIANKTLLDAGERGLFYPNRLQAITAFKNAKNQAGLKDIITSPMV